MLDPAGIDVRSERAATHFVAIGLVIIVLVLVILLVAGVIDVSVTVNNPLNSSATPTANASA